MAQYGWLETERLCATSPGGTRPTALPPFRQFTNAQQRDNFSLAWYNLSFHPVPQWNPLWLFITSLSLSPPSLHSPTPPCSLPVCPLAASVAFFFFPILFLLFSSLTLTLQRVFALKSLLLLVLPFSFSLSLSGGKSHTHQFAGSVPDERARKENINEAPQPINT